MMTKSEEYMQRLAAWMFDNADIKKAYITGDTIVFEFSDGGQLELELKQ